MKRRPCKRADVGGVARPASIQNSKATSGGTACSLFLTELSNLTIFVLQPYKIDRLCEHEPGTLAAVNGIAARNSK
jgi:hypothetical protein